MSLSQRQRRPEPHTLDMKLPPAAEIDNEPIRTALEAWEQAKAELERTWRDVVELENTREASEWADAEAAARARAEGKAEPKRSHVAAHDRALDGARHEHRVAVLAEARSFDVLRNVLAEHKSEWLRSVRQHADSLDELWSSLLIELTTLHGQRARAYAIVGELTGNKRQLQVLGFSRSQIRGIEFANHQGDARGFIAIGDLLAALIELGKPVPARQPKRDTFGSASPKVDLRVSPDREQHEREEEQARIREARAAVAVEGDDD